VVDVGGN